MNRTLVLVTTPLIAALLIAMFLAIGGSSPGSPDSAPAALGLSRHEANCGQDTTTVDGCPEVFTMGRRPLHC